MQMKKCRTRGAAFVLMAIVVLAGIMPTAPPARALECPWESRFYNEWEHGRLHDKPDLFSDYTDLEGGTEVCPMESDHRWLTTWAKVKLDNGDTGWVDDADLATRSEFQDSLRARHADKMAELSDLLEHTDSLELLMLDLGMTVPALNVNSVLSGWGTSDPTEAEEVVVSVPAPTPTPAQDEPCLSDEETQYFLSMLVILGTGKKAIDGVSQQLVRLEQMPTLLLDPTWRLEMVLWLASLTPMEEQLKAISVPPRMQMGHALYLDSRHATSEAATAYAQGIDQWDEAAFVRGSELLAEAGALIEKAGDAWQAVCPD